MLLKSRFIEITSNTKDKIEIGKICDVGGGYSFKSTDISNFGDIKILQIGNVYLNNVDWTITNYLPISEKEKHPKYLLKENDIVIALTRPIIQSIDNVKACMIKKDDLPCLLNQRVARISAKNINRTEIEYIYGCINSLEFSRYVSSCCTGSSQPNISTKDIEKYRIPNISYEQQVEFVTLKKQIDKSKFLLQQMIEKLELLKKSRFVEMFGSEKNKVTLKDCCEIHARIGWQALTKDEHLKSGDYMLITGTDFENNSVNYDSCVYVSKDRYEMDPHIILKNDDILVTKDGTIGKVAIVKGLPKPATLNSGIFVIRPDERFDKDYIANVFKGPIFSQFVDEVKTGATIKHLNQGKLQHFEIPVPSLSKQVQFSKFCNQLDKSKAILQKQLDDLVGSNK